MTTDPKTVEAELQDLIASYIIISTKDPLYVKEAKISARDEFTSKVQTIIKSSNLELLERVEGEIIGEDERVPIPPCCDGECGGMTCAEYDELYVAALARNQKRAKQRQTLYSIRKEYE